MPEPVAAPTEAVPVPPPTEAEEKPKLKPCCACPETKKARDVCIVEKGEAECGDLIEAHKDCMRKMGFNI
ncbi:cytochrome c oxidase copper chaperone-like [Patiria miniata]|uniref:Cytochrome c oxidase copper chaperone n=1 Tax=Patiria miniata TaxID=46514 RepID=A0A914BMJ8_PATMI|nr:cytochrome c oxidase copper chaperone-like [Patiria miniata]